MNDLNSISIDLLGGVTEKEEVVNYKKIAINRPLVITGLRKRLMINRIRLSALILAMGSYKNPIYWFGVIPYLIRFRNRYLGNNKHKRISLVDGKYYLGLYIPGWKGEAFNKFILSLLNDYRPIINRPINRFMFAVIAITKKCPLQCEHCYEWKNLNGKEVLSVNDLNEIVARIQRKGVGQIQFTGGEPLNRMEALLDVLRKAESSTDFWVTTSGYNLTHTNALKLKLVGLTGVVVSLDHFIPEKHNSFRGNRNSFHWAEEAIKNANANNLVTALSLCVTKDFVSKENLMAYFELAKRMNISFVQILEPKQVGRYEHNKVSLTDDQIRIVEDFVMDMNFNTEYRDYPCIIYHAYHNRRHGCLSAGHKGVYVDTDGDLNPCPFCHKKSGSVLSENFESNLEILRTSGCKEFNYN